MKENQIQNVCSNTSQFSKGRIGSYGAAFNSKSRSKTFIGVGLAMAQQWGPIL